MKQYKQVHNKLLKNLVMRIKFYNLLELMKVD